MQDKCWLFAGYTKPDTDYGYIYSWKLGSIRVHRLMYENTFGEIPKGLVLDHLCKITRCINPEHLEPVTQRENTMRSKNFIAKYAKRTHCNKGHKFTAKNIIPRPDGGRRCKACVEGGRGI